MVLILYASKKGIFFSFLEVKLWFYNVILYIIMFRNGTFERLLKSKFGMSLHNIVAVLISLYKTLI